jgi:CDP-glucose 4,6-dehydratase
MALTGDVWPGRRVLVTGHTGFKGGWLSLLLHRLGAEVTGYSLPAPTDPSLFEAAAVAGTLQHVQGDVRDARAFEECVRQARPEVVFHLAAQSLVRRSYQDPVETYSTNVMGTVTVLDVVRRVGGVRCTLVATSDKCYENREWPWGYRENEAMGGVDPYSSSKGCAELVTDAYRRSFFKPGEFARHGAAIASARAGNVIGGGDWAQDRLLPDMVRAFVRGVPARVRNPDAVRPWQHVLEPVCAYVELAARMWAAAPQFGEAWNFGPQDRDARTVREVVGMAVATWGAEARWEQDPGEHPHEARSLKLDCSKAAHLLGWRPRLDIETAIDWTVSWYKRWHAGDDMRAVSASQIDAYLARQAP